MRSAEDEAMCISCKIIQELSMVHCLALLKTLLVLEINSPEESLSNPEFEVKKGFLIGSGALTCEQESAGCCSDTCG